MTDLNIARSAAQKSAKEAFNQLADTEPERSEQAEGLEEMIDEGIYTNEMEYLEDELGHKPTEEEENEYVAAWKQEIQDLKGDEGLA